MSFSAIVRKGLQEIRSQLTVHFCRPLFSASQMLEYLVGQLPCLSRCLHFWNDVNDWCFFTAQQQSEGLFLRFTSVLFKLSDVKPFNPRSGASQKYIRGRWVLLGWIWSVYLDIFPIPPLILQDMKSPKLGLNLDPGRNDKQNIRSGTGNMICERRWLNYFHQNQVQFGRLQLWDIGVLVAPSKTIGKIC